MKTTHTNAKHTEWLSADEMHFESKKWLSELEFCKEEQWFFEDLIRSYTLQILDNNHFEESKPNIHCLVFFRTYIQYSRTIFYKFFCWIS